MTRSHSYLLLVGAVAVLFVGCNLPDLIPTSPTATPTPTPTATPTATLPALTIPILGAAPTATPTPAPAPNPTPAPTAAPTPAPPPTTGSCSLPPGNPSAPCAMGSPSFLTQVDQAITRVTQQQPNLFDLNNKTCDNCYYVKNQPKFESAVVQQMQQMGFCALFDGEELAVKNTNAFNDQYDILVSSGHIRRGVGSYRSTCTPSWF